MLDLVVLSLNATCPIFCQSFSCPLHPASQHIISFVESSSLELHRKQVGRFLSKLSLKQSKILTRSCASDFRQGLR